MRPSSLFTLHRYLPLKSIIITSSRRTSTTTTPPTHYNTQRGLSFSPSELIRTIKTIKGTEDDDKAGGKRLQFIEYSQPTHPNPLTIGSSPSTPISLSLSLSTLSKAELCTKYQIHPRNLSIISPTHSPPFGHGLGLSQSRGQGQDPYTPSTTSQGTRNSEEAVISPLGGVILVNLLYVKALITHSNVLLFSPLPPTSTSTSTSTSGSTATANAASTSISTPTSTLPGDDHLTRSTSSAGPLTTLPGPGLDKENKNEDGDGHEDEGEASLYDIFGQSLEERLSRDSVEPFEHRALESLLTSLASVFEAELALLTARTDTLVHDLAEDITREELNRLLGLRGAVGECLGRTVGVRRAVDRLLSEDADLAAAYLTAKATNTPRTTADHEELELLLENYSQRFEGIITGVNGALARIKSNQDVVELSLASTRNKLLLLDLKLSLCTVGLTLGAFGAGLLGMNLTNHFEDDPTAFYEVSAALILLTSVVGGLGIRALRRISRAGLGSLARIATRR